MYRHKPGLMPVLTVDFMGQTITDIEQANMGNYTQFCGYFRRQEAAI